MTIVGVGASAGGLEAFDELFADVTAPCGLAFVVVQHLDRDHKGMLPELLARNARLKVLLIADRMRVQPDHIYVIPPNRDLSILRGVLHLTELVAVRGLRLPIDTFFRSLAQDQGSDAVGVILSGMGADGTLGLEAIKRAGGGGFVQSPESARFDSMPRSAIDAGLADVVAPASDLASRILAYVRHVPSTPADHETDLAEAELGGVEKVVLLLRAQTGHDFSRYKLQTLHRRIERRLGLHQLPHLAAYLRFMRANPQEGELLVKELLIGVTSFFRDPAMWEQLRTEAIPALLAARPVGGTLRVWVAGCSTGEEAFSLAIVFREAVEALQPAAPYTLQVFATDLDRAAVERARSGVYPLSIATDVPEARLRRWFIDSGPGYRVKPELREMVVFAVQNVITDPPFTHLDLLSCRNLFIYLEPDAQRRLLAVFHYSLEPHGMLVLGSAETAGDAADLFAPVPETLHIYARRGGAVDIAQVPMPGPAARDRGATRTGRSRDGVSVANLGLLTESVLVARFAPPAVLTTARGDIVYISGRTGRYLEPAVGKANLNLFAMAREGLALPLHQAFTAAIRDGAPLTIPGVGIGDGAAVHGVSITVLPLTGPGALTGMVLVVFTEAPQPARPRRRRTAAANGVMDEDLALARLELQRVQDELRSTREGMQTSQEELTATNEEFQSANEELRSTNEELTTSREEMQSMNEELQTVNAELQARVEDLSLAADDLSNLLDSSDIATLFLDAELRVRRYTQRTTEIIRLIPGDVGRPIMDLATALDSPYLAEDSRTVLRTLASVARLVAAEGDRFFNVRIRPYRTHTDRIDGVVITFVDVTVSTTLEATLRDTLAILQRRSAGQEAELDTAHATEAVLREAQELLERRVDTQSVELRQLREGGSTP